MSDDTIEFGFTVDDARRLAKRVPTVALWLSNGRGASDMLISLSRTAFLKAICYKDGTEEMLTELRQGDGRLSLWVGGVESDQRWHRRARDKAAAGPA